MPYRLVILGSGTGSNARALLQAEAAGKLGSAQVAAIFSDLSDAKILSLGREFGVPAEYLAAKAGKAALSGAHEAAYIDRIRACEPDLIVLAGFMRVLKSPFIEAFAGRIINLHPSLLPSFPGLDGIGQALRHGVKVTGCTVHYVTPAVDAGPIIDQETVRIERSDTFDSLSAKVHAAEHELLPRVVARLSMEAVNAEEAANPSGHE